MRPLWIRGRRAPLLPLLLAWVTSLALLLLTPLGLLGLAEAKVKGKVKGQSGGAVAREYGCRVQSPQAFLMRRSYVQAHNRNAGKHQKALRWLIARYGNAGDPTTTSLNPDSAQSHAKTTQFFGMPISVHEKIVPALSCVEKRILATCKGKAAYEPKAIGGFRSSNTYRGGEVSNHLLGLAIDIDPDRNPCCGCVRPWSESPLCRLPARNAYERAALPRCWVTAFARYGFDWLGHDELEDTMHFEFLGDPDRIQK